MKVQIEGPELQELILQNVHKISAWHEMNSGRYCRIGQNGRQTCGRFWVEKRGKSSCLDGRFSAKKLGQRRQNR